MNPLIYMVKCPWLIFKIHRLNLVVLQVLLHIFLICTVDFKWQATGEDQEGRHVPCLEHIYVESSISLPSSTLQNPEIQKGQDCVAQSVEGLKLGIHQLLGLYQRLMHEASLLAVGRPPRPL